MKSRILSVEISVDYKFEFKTGAPLYLILTKRGGGGQRLCRGGAQEDTGAGLI